MSNLRITFDHIHIVSENPRSTVEWYVEKLGGQIEKDLIIQGAPQVFVKISEIFLIIRGQREKEAAKTRGSLQWGMDHFGFTVDGDFNTYCAELKQKGVTFILEPMDFSATSRIAYIEDPDGIKIELLQRK